MRKGIALILSISALLGISSIVMVLGRNDHRQKGYCHLCSKPDDANTSIDSNADGIGILDFNDFCINTLRICEKNSDLSGYASNIDTCGKTGSTILINSNLDRRIAEVTISIRKGSRPLQKKMARFLCADCCKKIEQENMYDVAFIDCRTKEIFPIKKNVVEFYIGDYAIHRLNDGDSSYSYLIFFAPEQ